MDTVGNGAGVVAAPGALGKILAWGAVWVVGIAAVVGIALLLAGNFVSEGKTYGRILVDTPEIYTRERLVNDRFLQEAWLSRQLEPAGGVQGPEIQFTDRRGIGFSAGSGGAGKGAGTEAGKPAGGEAGAGPKLATRAKLLEEIDYRELVRNLTIENQLDDRHDLNGNSLYKLKFDASVLPGAHTQASAHITVRVFGPKFLTEEKPQGPDGSLKWLGSDSSVEIWRKLYRRWIESLGLRLNQTHKELKHVFHNSEFSHTDYARLIDFLGRHLRVQPGAVEGCTPAMVDSRPEDLLPLGAQAHADRKKCLTAIVERSVPAEVMEPTGEAAKRALAAGPEGKASGAYVLLTSDPGAGRKRILSKDERSAYAAGALDHWLNSFFASKTVRLVLGVAVPEEAFVRVEFHNIRVLNNLARLTFFNALQQRPDVVREDAVFSVQEKTFDVVAIDPRYARQQDLDELGTKALITAGLRLAQFERVSFAPKEEFLVYDAPGESTLDGMKLSRGDFQVIADGAAVYKVAIEPGLYNFAMLARQHNAAFTYAVTPKESADLVSSNLSRASQVDANATPAEKAALSLDAKRDLSSRALERRATVVGFSGSPGGGAKAEFGWLIAPRQMAADGQALVYTQTPAQYSLSALVSLPAWWNSVRLQVTTSWIDKDGITIVSAPQVQEKSAMELAIKKSSADFSAKKGAGESPAKKSAVESPAEKPTVELPADFEALEALLLGIEQIGPELMDARLDPVLLTACQPGSILIPGRRLWRSTKVTLGYQQADSISVLPNMKGIIARFDSVQNQLSVEEEYKLRDHQGPRQILRTIRVWTSQGSLTLPAPASIGIPEGTARDCAKKAPTAQSGS